MELTIGHAARPFQHRPPCGDGWLSLEIGSICRIMLADGIGHGSNAHRIVQGLRQQLIWLCERSTQLLDLTDCLVSLHHYLEQQVKQSQAAVALLDLDLETHKITSLITGNVMVRYASAERYVQCLQMPGMLGGRLPTTLRATTLDMQSGSLLSLCSDGVDSSGTGDYLISRCRAGMHRGLHIQAEAEAMLRQFGRITDDASCILVSIQGRS